MQLLSNNYRNNLSKINFKGVTQGPIPVMRFVSYSTTLGGGACLDHYEVPPNATPNYPGAYPNKDTKIYRADPFEIIPEEIYKTHDYTIRDDLRLSQIKKDYRDGDKYFAKNAENEKGFLTYKRDEAVNKINEHNYYLDRYNTRLKYAQNEIAKEKYQKKINMHSENLKQETNQKNILNQTLENANARYKLLKEMDDCNSEFSNATSCLANFKQISHCNYSERNPYEDASIKNIFNEGHKIKQDYKMSMKNSDKRLNQIVSKNLPFEEKQKALLQELEYKKNLHQTYIETRRKLADSVKKTIKYINYGNSEISEYKNKIKIMEDKITQIIKERESIMAKIEKLYKSKYPNWL